MPRRKNISHEPVETYIPIGLPQIESLIIESDIVADRVRLLLHQVFLRHTMKRNSDDEQNDFEQSHWVYLHSKLLKVIATKRYKRYIKFLEDNDILEIKRNSTGGKSYHNGKYSQQYRLNDQLLQKNGSPFSFRIELVRDHKCLRTVEKISEYFSKTSEPGAGKLPLEPIHVSLNEMVNMVYFADEDALDFIKYSPALSDRDRDRQFILYRSVTNGHMQPTVDKFGQRFHHRLSNLKRELRSYIGFRGYENRALVELDFANSQPYFLSCVTGTVVRKLLPEFEPVLPLISDITICSNFRFFSKLCTEGVYEYWMRETGTTDRNKAKEDIMKVMFGRRRPTKNAESKQLHKAFKNLFPSVYKLLQKIKSVDERKLPFIREIYLDDYGIYRGNEAMHLNMSCMMQRLEARMVLKTISPKLIAEGLVPFITIHDSFITLAEHEQAARKIIEAEFRTLDLVPPSIKTKSLVR